METGSRVDVQSQTGETARSALLIQGGEVFDPAQGTISRQDISVADGRIAAIAPSIAPSPGARVVDARGLLVTPGLIDIHVHAFRWSHLGSIEVDPISSTTGVTTFVDGGSAGALNFMAFRKYVIEKVRSNLFALLNVSALGLAYSGIAGLGVRECDDPRMFHLASAAEMVEKNRDVIIGIKARVYEGLTSVTPAAAARELADTVGLPMVVHLAPAPPSFVDILPYLRAGDVVTHVFHPGPGSILDRQGRVREEYHEARRRGVIMDTAVDRMNHSLVVARAAVEQGFLPDILSTDLTISSHANVTIDLPTTLSKFLALGVSLPQVLSMATSAPARCLPPGRGFGELAVGVPADLALFELVSGEHIYVDSLGDSITGKQRLISRATIKDGEVLAPQKHEPAPFRFMPR